MAHSERTPAYRFPQFINTDKPTWLGDFNEAMTMIEAEMQRMESKMNDMQSQIVTLQNKVN